MPFDLTKKCVDINLLIKNENELILSFNAHHIALDGLSLAMLSFDIAHTYSFLIGEKKKLNLKEVRFMNFLSQKDYELPKYQKQLEYWSNEYPTLPAPLFVQKDFQGGRVALDLTSQESKDLKFYGYRNKSSLMNTLLLSLMKVLTKKYNREEFVIGIPMAGHENISDSMVGNCVNLLPFKIRYNADMTDQEFINQLKDYQLISFRSSEIPYELIKKKLGEDIIEIVLNVEPINELPKFGKLKANLMTYPAFASEYPIYINAMKVDDIVNITIDYQNSALTSKEEADKFLKLYAETIINTTS